MFSRIKTFFIGKPQNTRSVFIWNSIASFLNSGQSILLLMVISRIDPVTDAGILTISYAVANLLLIVGRYGIRHFQSSDLTEKYSFKEYVFSRVLSCIAMLLVCIFYLAYHIYMGTYSWYKALAVLMICLIRLVDAAEDVIHGFFQQHNHLETAVKIETIRFSFYVIAFSIVYVISNDLVVTGAISLLFCILVSGTLDIIMFRELNIPTGKFDTRKSISLLVECFPLFISMFLSTYLSNAPKYAVDTVLSDQMQAEFNYIFMPVFVITLLSMFIYQPMVTTYAKLWQSGKINEFVHRIIEQSAILIGLLLLALIGSWFLGIPVLSVVFGVSLSGYQTELVILVLGGGLLAFINYFNMILTVMRKQNWLLLGYAIVSLLFITSSSRIVLTAGTYGVSILYAVLTFLMMVYCLLIIIIVLIHSRRHLNG